MTKEHPSHPLLWEEVSKDFPAYSEIAVSFPDEWEHLRTIRRLDSHLYVAGLPPKPDQRIGRKEFPGLPQTVNAALTTYRAYKMFEPWPQPRVLVEFPEGQPGGHVVRSEGLTVQLSPIGQAQVWYGDSSAVIWECYFHSHRLRQSWTTDLADFWTTIEASLPSATLYTEPHEPDFPQGTLTYEDFLSGLGYAPAPDSHRWWQKLRPR